MPVGMQDRIPKLYYSIGVVPIVGATTPRSEPKIIRKIKNLAEVGTGMRTTMTLANGKVYDVDAADYIEGFLIAITYQEGEWNDAPANKWQFLITDKECSVIEVLQMGESAMAAGDIINRLAAGITKGEMFKKKIRITPYLSEWKNEKGSVVSSVHAALRIDGEKIPKGKFGKEEMPPIELIEIPGKKPVKNDSKRIMFWINVVAELNKSLPGAKNQPISRDEEDGDIPDNYEPTESQPAYTAPF